MKRAWHLSVTADNEPLWKEAKGRFKKDKTLNNSVSSLCLLSVSAWEWVSGSGPYTTLLVGPLLPPWTVFSLVNPREKGHHVSPTGQKPFGARVYLSREAGYQALAFLSAFGLLTFSQLSPSFPFGISGNQASCPPPSSTVTPLTLTHWTSALRRTSQSSKVEIFTLLFPDEKDGWQGLGWETTV